MLDPGSVWSRHPEKSIVVTRNYTRSSATSRLIQQTFPAGTFLAHSHVRAFLIAFDPRQRLHTLASCSHAWQFPSEPELTAQVRVIVAKNLEALKDVLT